MYRFATFFLVLLISALKFLFGQGIIQGVVKDSTSKEFLIGANVYLQGTALGGITDVEGKYRIIGIPRGSYKLRISYLGFIPKIVDVDVTDDRILSINASLIPDVIEGNEVIITAQARGQVAAINQQLTSNTIINVVSEEKIKELPDANAAEAIGRLPGVSLIRSGGEANKVLLRGLDAKFSNVTIDGIKIPPTDALDRSVDLSMLSQSTLAGVELFKALTPDKDGDALAGTINLVTKKAPETREIRADLKGNYNKLMESANQYDIALHYGERFFENIVGVQLTGNLEKKIRSNEQLDEDYHDLDKAIWTRDNLRLEFTDEIRKRKGVTLLLDFTTPDEGSIKISNVFGQTERNYLLSTREFPILGGGSRQSSDVIYEYREREQNIQTFNSSVRGDNNVFGLVLNWGLSFAQSDAYYPFDYDAIFVEKSGMNNPGTTVYQGDSKFLTTLAVNNFSSSGLDWTYFRTQDNFDKERTAFADIKLPYTIDNTLSGEFKFGGKYKVKNRSNLRSEDASPYYNGVWKRFEKLPDGTIRRKDFSGTVFEDWFNRGGGPIFLSDFLEQNTSREIYNSYRLFPLINRTKLHQWRELNKYGVDSTGNVSEMWPNELIKYDDYNITEAVSAGYLMNTLNVGQEFTLIAGLRVEKENNNYLSEYMTKRISGFPLPTNTLRDTTSSFSQTVVLPNVNISVRPLQFMNLRLAAYKAVGRPDFNMRLNRYIAGRPAEVTGQQQVFVGNPSLKSSQAWNFEINTSFFGSDIGLISISAYYKEIKDMYHMLNNFNTDKGDSVIRLFGIAWKSQYDPGTPYNLTLPYNSSKPTKVWGFEFEHQINFKFLPGYLQFFVLSYNASLVRSETYMFGSVIDSVYYDPPGPVPPTYKKFTILIERKQRLEGMPDYFGNISLGYDIGNFSTRISLFHKAQHDVSSTATGINDLVSIPYTRVDMVVKQKMTDYLWLYLNLNNITNSEDGTRILSRSGVPKEFLGRTLFDQSEKYGFTGEFGVTIQL